MLLPACVPSLRSTPCSPSPPLPRRLWITAEPHPQFPIGLLQMGIKITNEAPVGMKAGLRASYQWLNQVRLQLLAGGVAAWGGPAWDAHVALWRGLGAAGCC